MTSPTFTPPLLELLYDLHGYEFPLGISDYAALLEALSKGIGVGSRDELVFVCQTLWGKSQAEQEQIRVALESRLPAQLTTEEIRRLASESAADTPQPKDTQSTKNEKMPPRSESDATDPAPTLDERGDDIASAESAPRLPEWAVRRGGFESSRAIMTPAGDLPADSCRGFDFEGRLPITLRQMQRAWTYLRRMQLEGPSVELDAEATIDEIHRKGVLEAPVMVPRRVNRAKLLILKDESETMSPFARVTSPLVRTAASSGLAEVRVLRFRGIPHRILHEDVGAHTPVDVHQLGYRLRGASLLVISDAGCTRNQELDEQRVRRTTEFLRSIRELFPNQAWLNPAPIDRWRRASAEAIRCRTPIAMFPFDRAGLDNTIAQLRGKLALMRRG